MWYLQHTVHYHYILHLEILKCFCCTFKAGFPTYISTIWNDTKWKTSAFDFWEMSRYSKPGFYLKESFWTNPSLKQETHLVSEFDAIELVSWFEQLWPEGGGDELGVACQLHDHVWNGQTIYIYIRWCWWLSNICCLKDWTTHNLHNAIYFRSIWHNDNKTDHFKIHEESIDCRYKLEKTVGMHLFFLLFREINSCMRLCLRQPSCAGHRGPGRSHQTGRKERGHTFGWQILEPEPPETSDLQTAAASLSSPPASLWTTPTGQGKLCYYGLQKSHSATVEKGKAV